jgi:large subunit ribosomal protein L24
MRKIKQNKNIKKGDKVFVRIGNDRGQQGEVISRTEEFAIVQGINVRKKSVKKSEANPSGGFVTMERPIHLSKLALFVEKK